MRDALTEKARAVAPAHPRETMLVREWDAVFPALDVCLQQLADPLFPADFHDAVLLTIEDLDMQLSNLNADGPAVERVLLAMFAGSLGVGLARLFSGSLSFVLLAGAASTLALLLAHHVVFRVQRRRLQRRIRHLRRAQIAWRRITGVHRVER
jgi:hypothetical protein